MYFHIKYRPNGCYSYALRCQVNTNKREGTRWKHALSNVYFSFRVARARVTSRYIVLSGFLSWFDPLFVSWKCSTNSVIPCSRPSSDERRKLVNSHCDRDDNFCFRIGSALQPCVRVWALSPPSSSPLTLIVFAVLPLPAVICFYCYCSHHTTTTTNQYYRYFIHP